MNALGYTILHADGCETLGQFQDFPTDATAICEAIKRLFAMIGEDAQFERVSVWYKGGYTDMFVNQTGRLKGLRRNEAATAICRASVLLRQKPRPPAEGLSWIAGDTVLLSRRVGS